MPRVGITVYDLLLSCPGDVMDLKDTIDACVKSFNASIGEANNIRIELKHWSTDSFSQSGDKPQNILNKQFIDECDLCVALLGTRFGTPTDNYDSGTEEEIEKMLEHNKQVFLYFVERNVDPSKIDIEQYKKVQEFKNKYTDRGVYTVVKSIEELRTEFQNALSLYFIKLVAPHTTQLHPALAPELVISPTNTKETIIIPFHTNYQKIQLVKNKEKAIRTLIEKISAIKIIPSSEEFVFEADLTKDTEIKKSYTKQFQILMGTMPPKKVEINERQMDLLSVFCEQYGITLDSDFYYLGNLQMEVKSTVIRAFGNNNIEYFGTESEKEKYQFLIELFKKIREYNHAIEFFSNIDDMLCVSLMVENLGNTYDEDIDIKLFIEKNHFIDINSIPKPGFSFLEEAVKSNLPRLYFSGNCHAEIEDFSNYPNLSYIPETFSIPFMNRNAEIAKQQEKYQDLLDCVFCYNLRETDHDDILCFNIPYLKQKTKMFFPSFLFFVKTPKNIRYEIRSKHSPEVYMGTLTIENEC